jgi:hypothetical protein
MEMEEMRGCTIAIRSIRFLQMLFHGDAQGGTDASDAGGVYMTLRYFASLAAQIFENASLIGIGRAAVEMQ